MDLTLRLFVTYTSGGAFDTEYDGGALRFAA